MHCSTEFAEQVLPKFFKLAPTILPDIACELEIGHVRGVAFVACSLVIVPVSEI